MSDTGEVIVKLNKSLIRLKQIHGYLEPSDISADIIVNTCLNVLTKLYTKEYSDINHELNYREKLEVRSNLSFKERLNIENNSYYNQVIETYINASSKIVSGIQKEDLDYLRLEIYKLLKQVNTEEIILNYYLNRHKYNPFDEI